VIDSTVIILLILFRKRIIIVQNRCFYYAEKKHIIFRKGFSCKRGKYLRFSNSLFFYLNALGCFVKHKKGFPVSSELLDVLKS